MKIISVVFNKPAFIPYHYECLKKYILVPFEYIVFDNSNDICIQNEHKNICTYLNVTYIRVPQEIHGRLQDPSNRAGKSLDYALQYVHNTMNYKGIVMVVDSDMFLIKPYNPIERLGSFHVIGRSPSSIYKIENLEDPTKIFTYYTNQFLILNYNFITNIHNLSFIPTIINGTQLDCGGKLDKYFKDNQHILHTSATDYPSGFFSKSNINTCPTIFKEYFENELSTINPVFSEIIDDAFIHLRAGSNWINHPKSISWKRENTLFTFLCKKFINWNEIINSSNNNKYIISYSLYGSKHKYCLNAIMNAVLANRLYCGWISRFYYDNTVPQIIIDVLKTIPNTECILLTSLNKEPGHERMLWRFEAASDPEVAVMIVRDCDAWISFREAFSVKEWIKSDKGFHILRDHCYHSQKIMGGMWGIKKNIIPEMKELCEKFIKTDSYDQGFLATNIYPRIIGNVMVHTGEQYTRQGLQTNGYFNDGGIPIVEYPRIREYIPTIDIEHTNKDNGFKCLHCNKIHDFFIGEMFNQLNSNVLNFLIQTFPSLTSFK